MVPLWNAVWVDPMSEGLENYQFHPLWGPLFELMWAR